jgi:hypothetical protein
MILLLARIADQNATAFAREFAGGRNSLTRPSRLADNTPRHRHFGALNLLPAVFAEELSFYAEEERAYQTAELQALIVYFLSSLPCPVVNRPSTVSLTGPVQNPAAWLAVASAAGLPVARVTIASTGKPRLPNHARPTGTVADSYTMDLVSLLPYRCTDAVPPGRIRDSLRQRQ